MKYRQCELTLHQLLCSICLWPRSYLTLSEVVVVYTYEKMDMHQVKALAFQTHAACCLIAMQGSGGSALYYFSTLSKTLLLILLWWKVYWKCD